MKKILFIHSCANPTNGGAERVITNIYKSIDTTYFQKKFIALCDKPNGETSNLAFCLGAKNVSSSAFRLLNILRQEKPDIVFTSMIHVAALVNILRIVGNIKFLHISRMAAAVTNPTIGIYGKIIAEFFLKSIKENELLICQSSRMKREFVEILKVNEQNLIVVPNYLDIDFINTMVKEKTKKISNSTFKIVSMGRKDWIKGFEYGIDAVNELVKKGLNISYHIYGNVTHAKYEEALRQTIKTENLSKHVFLHDKIENPYPIIKQVDLLILPSYSEGFPNVIIESLLLGTPVVATDCADFTGIIEEGVNGYIVEIKNSHQMAECIEKALPLKQKGFKFQYSNFDYSLFFKNLVE